MTITTDFAGTESAGTVMTRMEAILDHYYGAGYFATLTTRGEIRAAANALLADDILADTELASSFRPKLNRLNTPAAMLEDLAILTATKNAAFWDFADAGTVFSSGTTPAVADGTIGLFEARAVGTVANADFAQANPGLAPFWRMTYAEFDGASRHMTLSAPGRDLLRNVGHAIFAAKFRVDNLSAERALLGMSRGDAQASSRFFASVTSDGRVNVFATRLDGAAAVFRQSAAGTIVTGTDYSLVCTVDFANGGAGAIKGFLNGGADVLNGTESQGTTLTGTGNTSNTTAFYASLGRGTGGSGNFVGRIYRAFLGGFEPSAGELALIRGAFRA